MQIIGFHIPLFYSVISLSLTGQYIITNTVGWLATFKAEASNMHGATVHPSANFKEEKLLEVLISQIGTRILRMMPWIRSNVKRIWIDLRFFSK